MGFIDEGDEILGKIIEEDAGTLTGLSARKRRRVVLYARTITHLFQHLDIVFRPRFEPLGLDELILPHKEIVLSVELFLEAVYGLSDHVFRHHEMLGRIDDGFFEIFSYGASRQRIEFSYPRNGIEIEFDPICFFEICRIYFQHISPYAESASFKDHIVALVLEIDEIALECFQVYDLAFVEVHPHLPVEIGRTQAIDAGKRSRR